MDKISTRNTQVFQGFLVLLQKKEPLDCYVQSFPISSGAKETYGTNEEDTYMDREETMKAAECLRRIDVEGYGLGFHELVAAGAVKAYLCGFPRQEALGMLQTIMKGTILKIPALRKDPALLQATIKGPELIQLVDTAVAAQIDTINKQSAKEGADIRKIAISSLRTIEGKHILENASPEFLSFLMDCHGALRKKE